ncbi:general stress protein [Salisediminibacterium selenitireducens]|uniref:General stress protein 17M-like domain-containing protein n=1 Tax=Bacillus selenitireducens (strain ATCC 700615 / DSM 15326 / MLS10) TaxID=439292 RepID=D6XZC3_BACIE|nr:general stress protein [Salisediminibacterium selenitireducens]ADI00408.1 hypothetical protein Bsel_2919 [[Bacillus] selenitireducens MLS10]
MDPVAKSYQRQEDVISAIRTLQNKGIDTDGLYIVYLHDDRVEHPAENPEAVTVGMNETNLGTAVDRIFPVSRDKAASFFRELGFEEDDALPLIEALEEADTVLVLTDPPEFSIL